MCILFITMLIWGICQLDSVCSHETILPSAPLLSHALYFFSFLPFPYTPSFILLPYLPSYFLAFFLSNAQLNNTICNAFLVIFFAACTTFLDVKICPCTTCCALLSWSPKMFYMQPLSAGMMVDNVQLYNTSLSNSHPQKHILYDIVQMCNANYQQLLSYIYP